MNETPFNITRDELLNLAADKLADQIGDTSELYSKAESEISKRISVLFAEGLKTKVDEFLTEEMSKIVSQEIVPVNIYGEREGQPTTIRATLAARAKEFWDVRVDDSGRPSSYGGEPRHQQLMKRILQDEFAKSVKQNADVIVAEFKKAIKADCTKLVSEHIDKLIK